MGCQVFFGFLALKSSFWHKGLTVAVHSLIGVALGDVILGSGHPDRQADRHRDRDTDPQTETETRYRQRQRQGQRQTDRQRHTHARTLTN